MYQIPACKCVFVITRTLLFILKFTRVTNWLFLYYCHLSTCSDVVWRVGHFLCFLPLDLMIQRRCEIETCTKGEPLPFFSDCYFDHWRLMASPGWSYDVWLFGRPDADFLWHHQKWKWRQHSTLIIKSTRCYWFQLYSVASTLEVGRLSFEPNISNQCILYGFYINLFTYAKKQHLGVFCIQDNFGCFVCFFSFVAVNLYPFLLCL